MSSEKTASIDPPAGSVGAAVAAVCLQLACEEHNQMKLLKENKPVAFMTMMYTWFKLVKERTREVLLGTNVYPNHPQSSTQNNMDLALEMPVPNKNRHFKCHTWGTISRPDSNTGSTVVEMPINADAWVDSVMDEFKLELKKLGFTITPNGNFQSTVSWKLNEKTYRNE